MNSIFNQLNGRMNTNPLTMVKQFNDFRQNFKGDAKSEVMNLMNSGRMSQEQFNQLQSMAQLLSNVLK